MYTWEMFGSFNNDTVTWDVSTGSPYLEQRLGTEGWYMVMVKASCMQHGRSVTSGVLYFSIRNGRVYLDGDTIVPPPLPDTTPPMISIPWSNPVSIGKLDTLYFSAVQAFDAHDFDVSDRIVVSGEILYGVPGTYYLTFTVADSAGNVAQARLEVRITRRQHEIYQVKPL
jgi:hypothetical protein